jgi:hypothetical protein
LLSIRLSTGAAPIEDSMIGIRASRANDATRLHDPRSGPGQLQTVIKAGNLIKGGNADRGFFNESNFYFLCLDPNIQQNLKYYQKIYHHIITLQSV